MLAFGHLGFGVQTSGTSFEKRHCPFYIVNYSENPHLGKTQKGDKTEIPKVPAWNNGEI